MTNFTYSDLDPGSVRLVELSSASRNTSIKCKFHIVEIQNLHNFNYICLSYEWGLYEAMDYHLILLDDKDFQVRSNVWNFLVTMLDQHRGQSFFIDAICINQFDTPKAVEEKNIQIQYMRTIYREANTTYVWLGLPTVTSEGETFQLDLKHLDKLLKRDNPYEIVMRDSRSQQATEAELEAFHRVFSNSFWKRLWIVQEVLLSTQVVVYCGRNHWDWSILQKASPHKARMDNESGETKRPYRVVGKAQRKGEVQHQIELEIHNVDPKSTYYHAVRILNEKLGWQRRHDHVDVDKEHVEASNSKLIDATYDTESAGKTDMSVYEALKSFGDQNCKLPRDKLFALYGIITERPFPAEYDEKKLNDRSVYKRIVKATMKERYKVVTADNGFSRRKVLCFKWCKRVMSWFEFNEETQEELSKWAQSYLDKHLKKKSKDKDFHTDQVAQTDKGHLASTQENDVT